MKGERSFEATGLKRAIDPFSLHPFQFDHLDPIIEFSSVEDSVSPLSVGSSAGSREEEDLGRF